MRDDHEAYLERVRPGASTSIATGWKLELSFNSLTIFLPSIGAPFAAAGAAHCRPRSGEGRDCSAIRSRSP